jgi:DNA (cytosine-5)-methyltransferase 1
MSLGFVGLSKGAFIPVWANDINRDAVSSYSANFGDHCVAGNINDLLNDPGFQLPAADLVIGGPPCQGFSLLNKNRAEDPRKYLWKPFLELVRRSQARAFVMENAPQILTSSEYNEILQESAIMGFAVTSATLCAANYGVAQTRRRAFIVGCTFADPAQFFPPKRTHFNPNNGYGGNPASIEFIENPTPWLSVRSAIGDLPTPVGTEMNRLPAPLDLHFNRNPTDLSMARYMAIPEQGMNRLDLQRVAPELTPECWIRRGSGGTDVFGRLWWDRPAFTIRTEFFKPEKGRFLHPEQHRPITHREAARLQSFPDDFIFMGSKIEVAKQIGNAVPPVLAARIADAVYDMFQDRN